MPGHKAEEAFHIPDVIPVGKFREPHHEKKHTDDATGTTSDDSRSHEAGIEKVTELKNAPKQNDGQTKEEAGLEGQPHGGA